MKKTAYILTLLITIFLIVSAMSNLNNYKQSIKKAMQAQSSQAIIINQINDINNYSK